MIKVKFNYNFCDPLYVTTMTPNNSGIWKNLQFVIDDSYDFLVIINQPTNSNYDPSRTIVFEYEPRWYLSTCAPRFYQDRMDNFFFHI